MKAFKEFLEEAVLDPTLKKLYDELREKFVVFSDLPPSNKLKFNGWGQPSIPSAGAEVNAGFLYDKLYPASVKIIFSPDLKDEDEAELKNVMAHEMVHLDIYMRYGIQGSKIGHGKEFWDIARQIPRKSGVVVKKVADI